MKKFLLLALLLISCRSYSQDFKSVYHEGDRTVGTTVSRFYSKEIMVNLPAIYRMINNEVGGFSYAKVDDGRIYWFVAVFEADNIYEGQSIKVVLVDSYRMSIITMQGGLTSEAIDEMVEYGMGVGLCETDVSLSVFDFTTDADGMTIQNPQVAVPALTLSSSALRDNKLELMPNGNDGWQEF